MSAVCKQQHRIPHSLVVVAAVLLLPGAASGEEMYGQRLQIDQLLATARPTLDHPLRVHRGDGTLRTPVWTHRGLWTAAPARLHGLRRVERPGHPTYDPATRAWYAPANGSLVRLEPDGRLPVLLHGVQGLDVDVRPRRGLAVSREPDHRIVLHRLRGARRTLLRGERFFGPRLSPDGARVLVSESRACGGHTWLLGTSAAGGGAARDLGRGYDAAWHPDGRRVVLSRVRHDGHRITAAELYAVDLVAGGPPRRLTRSPQLAEVEPAFSPDGRWIAFVDGRTGDLYVARAPGGAR